MERKIEIRMLPVAGIVLLFLFWECWNRQIYMETGSFQTDLGNYLSGFSKPDKRCLGWLFIHAPVQCYLIVKQSEFMRKFAVLWYFRNKNLRAAFLGFYRLYCKIPFFYYFLGFTVIYLKRLLLNETGFLWGRALMCCIFYGLVLTSAVMAACALVFVCFLFITNYQAAFSLVFFGEVMTVLYCGRALESGALFYKYWYAPFRGMLPGQVSLINSRDIGVLLTEILKTAAVLGIAVVIFNRKYGTVMGMDE